jgi:hypothetical protein
MLRRLDIVALKRLRKIAYRRKGIEWEEMWFALFDEEIKRRTTEKEKHA